VDSCCHLPFDTGCATRQDSWHTADVIVNVNIEDVFGSTPLLLLLLHLQA
jgi:hypothetical protein